MDPSEHLRLNISLRNFSAVAAAIALWESDEIQRDIRKYFKHWQKYIFESFEEAGWGVVVEKVATRCKSLRFPKEQLTLVQDLITPIGQKIFLWRMYLLFALGVKQEYTYKIYWTPLGTINLTKCFEKHWVKIAQTGKGKQKDTMLPYDRSIFLLACLFNQKGFLRAHLNEMRAETAAFLFPVKKLKPKSKLEKIIMLWLCLHFKKDREDAIGMYKELKKSKSIDKELFMKCLKNNLHEATKYFWGRLTQLEKKELILTSAETCIRFACNDHSEERSLEILVFLLNNMTPEERHKFCTEKFVILVRFFMTTWPYQEFAEVIFDEFSGDEKVTSRHKELLLTYFLKRVAGCVEDVKYVDKDLCRRLLKKVYNLNSKGKKEELLIIDDTFVLKLYEKFDIEVLSMILHDRDMASFREDILNKGQCEFRKLIQSRDFASLDRFIQSVFHSNAEKKKFKLKVASLPDLVSKGDYKLTDDVLNWITDSDEERRLLKKQIDLKKICSQFKTFKFELIDQLLSWQYNTEEERKKARESLKENNGFVCVNIAKIWNDNVKDGGKKCFEFLKWLSGTEEEAEELKNNLIIREDFLKAFCDTLPSWKKFQRIDELLQFLLLTPEDVLKIKQKMIKNSDEWINDLLVDKRNFKLAEAVVGWIFTDQAQKKKVMRNYINSTKGAMLLYKIHQSSHEGHTESLEFVLNSWVRLYGERNKIKTKLMGLKISGTNDWHSRDRLVTLCELVHCTTWVTESHINKFLPKRESDTNYGCCC